MNKYDYLIVGAGLAGSTLAYLLNKNGFKVKVIDKRNHIGGNCYTEKINNIDVHKYGAHIFHTNNKEIWNFINQFDKFNNFINSPLAITEDGELYNLPFNMNTFSKMFNIKTPDEAISIINKEIEDFRKINCNISNLEEQAINMVGTTIYEKLIKYYTEKQWNRPCVLLDSSIIKRLPLRFTYDNNYFNDVYQGIPINGYTEIIKNMLNNIEVKLNIDYIKNKKELNNQANNIIYTGRIDEYYDYKYGKLDFRSLRFETEIINIPNYQGNAVINYTGKSIPYTRIIEHKWFNNNTNDTTIITKEYPEELGDPYYPINNNRNNKLYQKYKSLSESDQDVSVIFAGRLGKYKYFDMDDVINDCFDIYNDIIINRKENK